MKHSKKFLRTELSRELIYCVQQSKLFLKTAQIHLNYVIKRSYLVIHLVKNHLLYFLINGNPLPKNTEMRYSEKLDGMSLDLKELRD